MCKVAVLYHSCSGHTATCAGWIAAGIEAAGAEAVCCPIEEVTAATLHGCGGVIFGAPTYMSGPSANMETFMQERAFGLDLAGRLGGAFATAGHLCGGGTATVERLLRYALIYGMLAYSGGAVWGDPFLHLGPVALDSDLQGERVRFEVYGERFARQVMKLFPPKG